MPNVLVSAERKLFYLEDVASGAANSEANVNKIASTINFVNTRITKPMIFGIGGAAFSSLSAYPYTFSDNSEMALENLTIQKVVVSIKETGTSGSTVFYLEKRLFGSGTWTNMFSTNCTITSSASDNLVFTSSDVSAPSGVTLPVLSSGVSPLSTGDEIRFVLVSASTSASNLLISLECSPI